MSLPIRVLFVALLGCIYVLAVIPDTPITIGALALSPRLLFASVLVVLFVLFQVILVRDIFAWLRRRAQSRETHGFEVTSGRFQDTD